MNYVYFVSSKLITYIFKIYMQNVDLLEAEHLLCMRIKVIQDEYKVLVLLHTIFVASSENSVKRLLSFCTLKARTRNSYF